MEIEIEWSQLAEKQLKDIFDYYHSKANSRIADRIVNEIIERVSILYLNPRAGQKEELLKEFPEEYRYLVESNYKIIYWQENKLITISTVFDCRQNPIKMMNTDYGF
ncbi:MAG: type II toxin-antitoxin system RelE/ParE family toxin [Bacteroidetes bacterium]|nr:MAG: type II toxin-antitoxin system RelE/ParE family toxin [Bacteroidota bacterium]